MLETQRPKFMKIVIFNVMLGFCFAFAGLLVRLQGLMILEPQEEEMRCKLAPI